MVIVVYVMITVSTNVIKLLFLNNFSQHELCLNWFPLKGSLWFDYDANDFQLLLIFFFLP